MADDIDINRHWADDRTRPLAHVLVVAFSLPSSFQGGAAPRLVLGMDPLHICMKLTTHPAVHGSEQMRGTTGDRYLLMDFALAGLPPPESRADSRGD